MLPVLILPGIMSSGLEVRKSGVDEKHVGERVWINPVALGFGALYMGRALEKADDDKKREKGSKRKKKKKGYESDDESHTDDEAEAPCSMRNSQYRKELECKSSWLQHLSLRSDLCTERLGNEIRAIPGLDGVDFLTDLATIKVGASYVFGPIIKMMVEAGYTKGKNLDAATYDWRVPPSVLEERDGYFTGTLDRIERMYDENGGTPVVLLCHSMGSKTGHYLLNFAKERRGREWIDKYVHTYMPVGAPHIGAPSTIGQAFNASLNPLLAPLLSDEERLIFGRSLGSVPWLMPTTLPSNATAPPTIMCKREGTLEVKIVSAIGDCDKLVRNKHGTRNVEPFVVCVHYGGNVARSGVAQRQESEGEDSHYFHVSESLIFPTPPTLDGGLESLQFVFREPGDLRAHDKEKMHVVWEGLKLIDRNRGVRLALHAANKKAGKFKSTFAMTTKHAIDSNALSVAKGYEIEMQIPIISRMDMTLMSCTPKENARSIDMTVRLRWNPPVSNEDDDTGTPIAMLPEDKAFAPPPLVESGDDPSAAYVPLSGQALLRAEGLGNSLVKLTKERYQSDRLGPRSESSADVPPVGRVYAVYGINLDTWVGSVCRRAPSYVTKKGRVKAKFVMDKSAKLVPEKSKDQSTAEMCRGYKLEDGIIKETPSTPQKDFRTGETIRCSGDGTVPYWSLQHAQLWQSAECQVRIKEIEGAGHRAILADERFHKVLLDYVGGKDAVEVHEAEAAKKLQKLARAKS